MGVSTVHNKKIFTLFLVLILICLTFAFTMRSKAQAAPAIDRSGGNDKYIQIMLKSDGAPAAGGSANLSFDATPFANTQDLVIEWFIPQDVELQGAASDTFGPQTSGTTVHADRVLTFPTPGTYKIAVTATFHQGPEASFSAAGVLFFVIDGRGGRVSDKDPDAKRPVRSGLPEQNSASSTPAIIQSPNGDPCFTVTGHIDRIDLPVTSAGYGPAVTVPVVNAPVEIRESDTLFDDSYGTVLTDYSGNFSKSFCDDDGLFDDTLEIYYRLVTERRDGGGGVVYVEDSSWIDEKYEYDSNTVSSGGGTINFNLNLDMTWSGMFNIVDAASLARNLWRSSGDSYSEDVEIHWEAGYGDSGSYFNPFWNEITIADDPSDPDQWDDSVIMHEWGHSADDYYSCDDNPGGDHYIDKLVSDDELSWGEGYPDYYQSAVRAANGYSFASWYLDINGSGVNGIKVNFEDYDVTRSANLISTFNELAVAAALWDLNDNVNDGQDTVSYGHATIQDVYTSSAFNDAAYGFFDDTCNFDTYMRGWIDAGKAKDAATAAVVLQNTGYTLPTSKKSALVLPSGPQNADTTSSVNTYSPADVYRWWKQLTYVADNSASMAGPKYDAMKTLFAESINDLGSDPLGVEFSLEQFNNTSSTNEVTFAGQFFPANLVGPINALTPSVAADLDCPVYALQALSQAIDNKEKGDVWLFTDGDTIQSPSVGALRQALNDKQMRASVALMGICPARQSSNLSKGPISTEILKNLTPAEQQSVMDERLLRGQARAVFGPAADSVPGGLVPYLLTALNSGGQFLYVNSSQVNNAAEILRAQITNSAGAGRWSDYVSDSATYRWDSLASFEYNWIDATNGTVVGNPDYNSYINVPLPASFSFYDIPYSSLNVFQDGYVSFGNHLFPDPANTAIPFFYEPNNTLDIFWDDLVPSYIIPKPEEAGKPGAGNGNIYTKQSGDWFVLEYNEYLSSDGTYNYSNTFEILLNPTTGEIRYQYLTLPNGAAGSTIGVENNNGFSGIQVSYNDISGAGNNMGYKFIAAPPQPAKMYTVTVDSSMQSVGFLLTGYSGTFEPLAVSDSSNTLITCTDAGVLCLDLDLVQYVQVNTNGRTGDWHAVVDAGSSGEGTFSFTSFAASPLAVESKFDHSLSTSTHNLLIDLTQPVDGGALTGYFLLQNGAPFGGSFSFFDDGTHGDGKAGDGLFGSEAFTPPAAGSAFLRLSGQLGGEDFERIDPRPYTFSPLEITAGVDGYNDGGPTFVEFQVTNSDSHDHCYWVSYDAPAGWWLYFAFLPAVCVNAGQSQGVTLSAYMTDGTSNDLPSGTTGILTVSFTEWEKGEISDSASTRITRTRLPAAVTIFTPDHTLRPGGDMANLEIDVVDEQNVMVANGNYLALVASNGTISPTEGYTAGGMLHATFTSGASTGTAQIIVTTSNGITATTEILIEDALPNKITLQVGNNHLLPDGVSQTTLIATVTDSWGNPMAGQSVTIGVEGDGKFGTVMGGEVASGLTDVNGQFTTVFTTGTLVGHVGVRADLYYDQGSGPEVVQSARQEILLGIMIYLPAIQK
jgi:hypothetical protein